MFELIFFLCCLKKMNAAMKLKAEIILEAMIIIAFDAQNFPETMHQCIKYMHSVIGLNQRIITKNIHFGRMRKVMRTVSVERQQPMPAEAPALSFSHVNFGELNLVVV